jgi:single-strand DNA-binding protein
MINYTLISGNLLAVTKRFALKPDGSNLEICEGLLTFSFYGRGQVEKANLQIVAYGKAAEALAENQGKNVIVEGRFEQQPAVEGSKIKPIVVVARTVHGTIDLLELNTVSLVGRLGQDPEVKFFGSGANVSSGSIAISVGGDKTCWLNFKAWEKVGALIADYCRKGSQLSIVGRLTMETWEGGSKLVVKAEDVQLPPKAEGGDSQSSGSYASRQAQAAGAVVDDIF